METSGLKRWDQIVLGILGALAFAGILFWIVTDPDEASTSDLKRAQERFRLEHSLPGSKPSAEAH